MPCETTQTKTGTPPWRASNAVFLDRTARYSSSARTRRTGGSTALRAGNCGKTKPRGVRAGSASARVASLRPDATRRTAALRVRRPLPQQPLRPRRLRLLRSLSGTLARGAAAVAAPTVGSTKILVQSREERAARCFSPCRAISPLLLMRARRELGGSWRVLSGCSALETGARLQRRHHRVQSFPV